MAIDEIFGRKDSLRGESLGSLDPKGRETNNNMSEELEPGGPDKTGELCDDKNLLMSAMSKKADKRQVLDIEDKIRQEADGSASQSRFVEIDPLALERECYSPTLIYLCTVIYSLMPLASASATITLIGLMFSRYFYIPLIYATYIFLDRKTCIQGGRRFQFVYKSRFWSYLAAYFPIKLRHPENFKLDERKNYILNYHPHGISAFGSVTAFATNGLKLSELFPGITARFMVHQTSFSMPIMKETFSSRGDCSVSSRSIDHILSQNQKGNLLTIVVGGLAEADLSDMQTLKVVVAQRKGFVKKALVHGASLIPCIAFGENSVYTKINFEPSSLTHRLESLWYKLMKFKHPLYYGQSLFSDKLKGVLPYQRPITVVMGKPIDVECNPNPTSQEIDELHRIYITNLKILYESNQDLCAKYDTKLVIV